MLTALFIDTSNNPTVACKGLQIWWKWGQTSSTVEFLRFRGGPSGVIFKGLKSLNINRVWNTRKSFHSLLWSVSPLPRLFISAWRPCVPPLYLTVVSDRRIASVRRPVSQCQMASGGRHPPLLSDTLHWPPCSKMHSTTYVALSDPGYMKIPH